MNEKEKLRLDLERIEQGRVTSEASESKNDETHVKDHAQLGTEGEIRSNDATGVTIADYV